MNYSNLLFLGFLSLLLTVVIIGFMNLVKQSYVLFCVSNLQGYEREIRRILGEVDDAQIFCLNLEKETKFIKTFRLTFGAFASISALAITCIPFAVLWNSNALHALIYLLMAIMVFTSYFQVLQRMVKQYFNKASFL